MCKFGSGVNVENVNLGQRHFCCDSIQDWKIYFQWPRYKINRLEVDASSTCALRTKTFFFCDSFQDWKINFRWPRYKINRGRCFLHMCPPNKELLFFVIHFKIGKSISNDLDTKLIEIVASSTCAFRTKTFLFYSDPIHDWKINFKWPRYKINRGRCFLHMCLPNKDLLFLWFISRLEN